MTEGRLPIEKTRRIVEAALDRKAEHVVALDVRGLCSFADVFVLATGTSDRHVRSISDAIAEALRRETGNGFASEGYSEGRWVLMDAQDVIVHVFLREIRDHYDIERLWSDAPELHFADERAGAAR